MKKSISVLLALLMLFTVLSLSVSAVDDTTVVRMWLCAEKSTQSPFGHIFLYFENLTGQTVTVGKYKVSPYGDVSVGSFGTEGPRGGGIYYNLESKLDHYNQLIGISTELDAGELKIVSDKIKSYNRWDPIFNCNYFALRAWNAGSDSDIAFLIFPQFTRMFISLKGGIANPYDPFVRNDPVVKQTEL